MVGLVGIEGPKFVLFHIFRIFLNANFRVETRSVVQSQPTPP